MSGDFGSNNQLLHAIDLALVRDWSDAKSLAESIDSPIADRLFLLLSEIEEREASRIRQLANVRHEIGNALSIAQANLEAIIDGLLEPTTERLNALLAALGSASTMLDELRRPSEEGDESDSVRIETFNLRTLVEAHVSSLLRLAEAKNVKLKYNPGPNGAGTIMYRGDAARIGQTLRNVIVNAIRYTPPAGTVEVHADTVEGGVRVAIRDHHQHSSLPVLNKLLKAVGGEAQLEAHAGEGENILAVMLPMETANSAER